MYVIGNTSSCGEPHTEDTCLGGGGGGIAANGSSNISGKIQERFLQYVQLYIVLFFFKNKSTWMTFSFQNLGHVFDDYI